MAESLILQKKRATCTFRQGSSTGPVYDPENITGRVGRVTGDDVEMIESFSKGDMQNPSVGVYYFEFTPEIAGTYFVRFTTDDGVDRESPAFPVSGGNTPLE